MIKKITTFILSFLVILISCSAAFVSSALVPTKSVPFPSPDTFLTPYGSCIVYAYHTSSNTTVQWRSLYVLSSTDSNFTTHFSFSGSKLTCNVDFQGSSEVPFGYFMIYSFNYTAGQSSYTTSFKDYITLSPGEDRSVTNSLNTSWVFDFVQVYGNCDVSFTSPYSQPSNKFAPTFNGDISFSDLSNLFSDVSSDLATLHSDFNSLLSKSDTLHSDLNSVNSKLDTNNSRLNTLHSDLTTSNEYLTSITLYCIAILEELRAESYTEPPSTTVNQDMSEYEQAEQVFSDDSFAKLDNLEFEGLSSSLGSFGSGFSGALSFLSSNMEFFSGNQTASYGSSDDDSAIRKISVVILIVLSLGLVSFVLNLVSSKGSD